MLLQIYFIAVVFIVIKMLTGVNYIIF